jgi:predicted HicB family RNase H-like nuclease
MSKENKAPKKRGRGRPPLPKGHVKAKIVPMRLTDEDVKLFSKAAEASKQSLSEWMRSTLRDAATGTSRGSRT